MYKVLIIKDEPAFQLILKDTFEKEQFEVFVASEGKQGMIETAKNSPDFILLDLMMPGMDGATFLWHIKSISALTAIPVAILTVVPDGVPQKLRGEEVFKQVVGFWVKDTLTPKKIVQKVKDYLDNQSNINRKRVNQ